MQKFDIPVNFQVVSQSEQSAVNQLIDFLRESHREFAANYNITDSELVEFIAEGQDRYL